VTQRQLLFQSLITAGELVRRERTPSIDGLGQEDGDGRRVARRERLGIVEGAPFMDMVNGTHPKLILEAAVVSDRDK
jgi:hypothetical protein